jgi:hypothetical protein
VKAPAAAQTCDAAPSAGAMVWSGVQMLCPIT